MDWSSEIQVLKFLFLFFFIHELAFKMTGSIYENEM